MGPFNVGDIITPKMYDERLSGAHGVAYQVIRVYVDAQEGGGPVWLVDVRPIDGKVTLGGLSNRGWFAHRFELLKTYVPKNPILERINKLYKKCKTTQHWEINDAT